MWAKQSRNCDSRPSKSVRRIKVFEFFLKEVNTFLFFIRTKFIRTPSLKFFEILRTFWRLNSMCQPVLSKKSFHSWFTLSQNLFHSWIPVDWNETWGNRLTDYSHYPTYRILSVRVRALLLILINVIIFFIFCLSDV